MDYLGNPNPSYNFGADNSDPFEFELSDLLALGDGFGYDNLGMEKMAAASSSEKVEDNNPTGFVHHATESRDSTSDYNIEHVRGLKKKQVERGIRVAFRTKSELEVMDDGYKWRKYGKKSVKNSPNPRNYYKCSSGNCQVKKRVERDREDASYVITSYEGVHNHVHATPSSAYYSVATSDDIHSLLYYVPDHSHRSSANLSTSPLQAASNYSNSSSSS